MQNTTKIKIKKSSQQFTREQHEQWTKQKHGSTSAMDLNPSQDQSLNQDFIKSLLQRLLCSSQVMLSSKDFEVML